MKKLGYTRSEISYVVGLHDEEQYNSDIYRKVFVHGVKHTKRIPLFVEWWKENLQNDPDFKVALYALSDSIRSTEKIDRKSTRLNSSHVAISYAVFCLKKKNKKTLTT